MDPTRVEQIYDQICSMSIELEPDPTVLGPRYLNDVVAKCRNYMNQVTIILLQLQREKRGLSRQLLGEEAAHKVESDRLLAENEVIKRLPNIKDREAQANVMLSARVDEINRLKREILDLDTIEKAVRLRHQELIRTSDNIKTQRSLLHADRTSGAGYGDEFDGPRDAKGRPLPRQDDIDENELDRLVAQEEEKALGADRPKLVGEAPLVDVPAVETARVDAPIVEASPEPTSTSEPTVSVEVEVAGTKNETTEVLPEPVAPAVEVKPEPAPSPVEIQATEQVVASEPTPAPETPAPVEEPKKAEVDPLDAAMSAQTQSDDAAIESFLKDSEPAKTANGNGASTNGKKKESKPEVSPPAGEDDGGFDFSDILKSI